MTLTLLLDLDDTLLTSRMETTFQGAYLKALSSHLLHFFPPDFFVQKLLTATQHMIQNDRPDRTLEEVFDSVFYPSLGVQRAEIQELIDSFYAEVFPSLQPMTSPRPEAVELVETALQKGYRIVIATNPLFPLTAIQQRLSWAGLPPEVYPFELISSYETFHFAKPNPAYYAELLAQLGWPSEPAIMVGNDFQGDILPASSLGIHTFYVENDPENGSIGLNFTHARGALGSFLEWLENLDLQAIQPAFTHPTALTAILKATPAALSTLTRSLSAPGWIRRPVGGEWSLTEIICHLRDVEIEVNISRLERIVSEANPFVPGMDTDPWAEERQYQLQSGTQALRVFIDARLKTLKVIESLEPDDWERTTRHAIFGPTPVRELIGFIATHDRSHLQQIRQTLEIVRSFV